MMKFKMIFNKKLIYLFIAMILCIGTVNASLNSSVKLYLPMNNSFSDISQYGNTITPANSPTFNDSHINYGGYAANFSNTLTQYIDVTNSANFYGMGNGMDGSVSFWIYPRSYPSSYAYLMRDNQVKFGNAMQIDLTGGLVGLVSSVGDSSDIVNGQYITNPLQLNEWSWVSEDFSNGNFSVYVNGVKTYGPVSMNGNVTYNAASAGYPLRIASTGASASSFNGMIDDFVITKGYSVNGSIVPTREFLDMDKPYTYYAYGDSITRAIDDDYGIDPLPDGSQAYILQMRNTHDPTASALHNLDGSGEKSTWGLLNVGTHIPDGVYPKNIFIMFGKNDQGNYIDPVTTAQTLKSIYVYYTYYGTNSYILIPPLSTQYSADWSIYSNQYSNISIIKNWLYSNGVPNTSVVNMYDAIDSNPRNGIPDITNTSLMMTDNMVHPNGEGQRLMGEYLWDYLQGDITYPPIASFTSNVTSGVIQSSIQFNDTSTNNPIEWNWSFGDDTFSTDQNPVHEYQDFGLYTVSLNATNADGSSEITKTDYITIGEQVSTSFHTEGGSIELGYPSIFVDDSTGSPTSWLWDFGDNITSTEQNPTHYYTHTGVYSISLTASNGFGSDTLNIPNYITIYEVTPTPTPTPTSTFSTSEKIANKMTDMQGLMIIGLLVIVIGVVVTLVAKGMMGSK